MKVYPIFLNDLSNRRCVVIGGDEEAERKAEGLLACDASLTVISHAVTERIATWAGEGWLIWIERDYQPGDLRGAFLVICAGQSPAVNKQVWAEANGEGALINVIDDVPHCNFVAGSVVRRGALVVSISTSGAAPALAVRLRQRLEAELGPEYAEFLEVMEGLRGLMVRRFPAFEERRARWYQLVDSEILDHLRDGQHELAQQRLMEIVGGSQ